jgi:hypothetical protein
VASPILLSDIAETFSAPDRLTRRNRAHWFHGSLVSETDTYPSLLRWALPSEGSGREQASGDQPVGPFDFFPSKADVSSD